MEEIRALKVFLSGVDDLDAVSRAVEREREIRIGMARTGQGREVVAESLDAQAAMDDEAVLDLTEGQPTTLVDALTRLLETWNQNGVPDGAEYELAAVLTYPWPEDERRISLHSPHHGLALHTEHTPERDLVVKMGSNRWEVARVSWEDAGSGGILAAEAVAEAVYRATLARVIPDREHIVQLNAAETAQLRRWLNGENTGSNWIGDRLTLNPAGDGVWIRTRPYNNQHIPARPYSSQSIPR